jgi:hypothetical protein
MRESDCPARGPGLRGEPFADLASPQRRIHDDGSLVGHLELADVAACDLTPMGSGALALSDSQTPASQLHAPQTPGASVSLRLRAEPDVACAGHFF